MLIIERKYQDKQQSDQIYAMDVTDNVTTKWLAKDMLLEITIGTSLLAQHANQVMI